MVEIPQEPVPLIVWGAGGHARVVAEAARLSGRYQVVAHLVDEGFPADPTADPPVQAGLAELEAWWSRGVKEAVVGIGDNAVRLARQAGLESLGWRLAKVIHPSASVSPTARLGEGTCVMAGAVVQAGAIVGRAGIVNTLASVDHDCQLGDGVHIAPGVRLCGGVRIGRCTLIGAGTVIPPGRTVGAECLVGAGSVVTRDLPDQVRAWGVPARVQPDTRVQSEARGQSEPS